MRKGNGNVKAVIWDFDGTLVHTMERNFAVTRKIVEKITGRPADSFPILESISNYVQANKRSANWKELYKFELGVSNIKAKEAGALWDTFQKSDNTPVTYYTGLKEALEAVGEIPQGIVSQNAKHYIREVLRRESILHFFLYIVGYEEVSFSRQKPEPDGLLLCMENLTNRNAGTVFYVGDHETDAVCVHKTNAILRERGIGIRVVHIGAFFDSFSDGNGWRCKPEYKAHSPKDVLAILQRHMRN